MKRFILSLVLLFLLSACSSQKYEYTITYKVYYTPTEVRTYTDTHIGREGQGFYVRSDRGSNYICCYGKGGHMVIETSAPIEVISNTCKKIEK